jgi:uncharacterized membrane protein
MGAGAAYTGVEGWVVSVPFNWVVVVRGAAGAVGAVGAAIGVASSTAIGVASSTAIGTTGGWVDQRYSKGPTGTLLDSGRLCILGGLVAVG